MGGQNMGATVRQTAKHCWATAVTLLLAAASVAAWAAEPIPDVGPAGDVKKIAGDFGFTEGPAWDGRDTLFFADIPNAKIHTLSPSGEVSVFVEDSGPV